jgi:hypothetical protein
MIDEVDDMLAEVQRTIATRRANGDYPIGLEAQLEGTVKSVHQTAPSTARVAVQVAKIRDAVTDIEGTSQPTSRVPGGTTLHSAAARVIGRHTDQLAHHLRVVGETSASALEALQEVVEAQQLADARQLTDVLAGVLDRLAMVDELTNRVSAIESQLVHLQTATTPNPQ